MTHTQPHKVRPPLTADKARQDFFHHTRQVRRANTAIDARMAKFHAMRASYLAAAVVTGVAR